MIRAVFFDWYSTLANIDASRAAQYVNVFKQAGIDVPTEKASRGILRADEFLTLEEGKRPFAERSHEERAFMYIAYPRMILDEMGLARRDDIAASVRDIVRDLRNQPRLPSAPALFDDVMPVLKTLKERGILLGVISNASRELGRHCQEIGLMPYLEVVLTSQEAGARKPEPLIFQTALDRAKISAAEAVFVGGQYKADVLGARGVGMRGILLDRFNLYPHITDCPRIRSLAEILECIK